MANGNGQNRGGRPSKYKPELCEKIVDFFSIPLTKMEVYKTETYPDGRVVKFERLVANDPPFLIDFVIANGLHWDTIHDWSNPESPRFIKEFSDAFNHAKKLQEKFLSLNAIQNRYAQAYSIFYAKNMFGWRDSTELVGNEDKPLPIKVISYEGASRKSGS